MNAFRLIIVLILLVVGLVIGVLNHDPVKIFIPFVTEFETTSGISIIVSLLVGVFIGGLVVMVVLVLPQYNKLRKVNKALNSSNQTTTPSSTGSSGTGV